MRPWGYDEIFKPNWSTFRRRCKELKLYCFHSYQGNVTLFQNPPYSNNSQVKSLEAKVLGRIIPIWSRANEMVLSQPQSNIVSIAVAKGHGNGYYFLFVLVCSTLLAEETYLVELNYRCLVYNFWTWPFELDWSNRLYSFPVIQEIEWRKRRQRGWFAIFATLVMLYTLR